MPRKRVAGMRPSGSGPSITTLAHTSFSPPPLSLPRLFPTARYREHLRHGGHAIVVSTRCSHCVRQKTDSGFLEDRNTSLYLSQGVQ
jgi:hypothetical protein